MDIDYFEIGFKEVIAAEGGYSDDPNDSGGKTKFGISQKAYPDLDIAALTLADAKAIYKRDYWDKIKGDLLHYPLNIYVFDCAVNQGVGTAIKLLQKTVGVPQDGILGTATLSAVRTGRGSANDFLSYRAVAYTGTRGADIYLRGWLKRLFVLAGLGRLPV